MDLNNIWRQRFSDYIKELSRYLKYMFNDHLMIVAFIGASAGAVYYRQWLAQLPETFPFEWIMGVILGLVISTSSIRSFLKEPDLVFLLPVEHKMNDYFRKGIQYSFFMHAIGILVTFLIMVPMYNQFSDSSLVKLMILFFIMLVLKGWNLFLTWRMLHQVDGQSTWLDFGTRFIFTTVFLVLLFQEASSAFLYILFAIAILWAISFDRMTKGKTVKWELLLQMEQRQMNRFYQLANLFVDVPHLRSEVKPRRWLNWLFSSIPLKHDKMFDFLYLKTFVRTGEYLGIYMRLLVIGGFILSGVHFTYGSLIIVPFFIYLSGLQLFAMFKQHDQKLWLSLYPIRMDARRTAFLKLLFRLMLGYVILLSVLVIFIKGAAVALLCAVISTIFTYLFIFMYLKNKLVKVTE
ncbi:ABC transporter permease [Bacillus pinisoli]|uniref:ABC transporter permease n=1 Tax=Bacillus pinisoli TaxID=2901866 RepID=UPI001FF0E389|nr:ABC transporter permease [Bacillus pinisoli]